MYLNMISHDYLGYRSDISTHAQSLSFQMHAFFGTYISRRSRPCFGVLLMQVLTYIDLDSG